MLLKVQINHKIRENAFVFNFIYIFLINYAFIIKNKICS